MASNVEKINFNVPANLKKDIERLAATHGKTLSAFLVDVCSILVTNNRERIQEQAQREKEPINFGVDVKPTKKTTKPKAKKAATKKTAAPPDSPVIGVDDNG